MDRFKNSKCINQFSNRRCSTQLRLINNDLQAKLPESLKVNVTEETRICSSCYLYLSMNPNDCCQQSPQPGTSKDFYDSGSSGLTNATSCSSEEDELKRKVTLDTLNTVLPALGLSPMYESNICQTSHNKIKFIKLASSLNADIKPILSTADENLVKSELYDEMICQLKNKFNTLEKTNEKIQLLTVMPKSVSQQYIQNVFNTTGYIAKQSKILQDQVGVFAKPERKIGKRISADVEKCVMNFYNDDEVSRVMPGINDCFSIRWHWRNNQKTSS